MNVRMMGVRGLCSDEKNPPGNIKRNRNVNVDEVEATLPNILDHFSLVGPFPVLTTNEAVRVKGLAELYGVLFFFSLVFLSFIHTTTTPVRNEPERLNRIIFCSNHIFCFLGFVILCVMILS